MLGRRLWSLPQTQICRFSSVFHPHRPRIFFSTWELSCQTPWRLKQKKRRLSRNLVPSRPKTPFYAQAPAKHALICPWHLMAETEEKTSFYCSSKTFSGLFILKLHHILWKTGMNEYRQRHFGVLHTSWKKNFSSAFAWIVVWWQLFWPKLEAFLFVWHHLLCFS